MEIKATLNKPYTNKQRMDFIVQQNHNKGYEIKETETSLEAWGKTEEEMKPTREELENARAIEYAQLIDPLHAQKQRRLILGTWSEEDEEEYVEKVKQLSNDIALKYPYE